MYYLQSRGHPYCVRTPASVIPIGIEYILRVPMGDIYIYRE